MTHPSGLPVFERFFRSVANIKIDRNDVRRFREFVDEQIDDIAISGRTSAKSNGRDVIVAQDLPITKGMQERMREFDKLEEADEIRQLLLNTEVREVHGDETLESVVAESNQTGKRDSIKARALFVFIGVAGLRACRRERPTC
ncbi:DUF1931 family protein [Mycobacterium simiae]|uniref:DUF1931 family protein n=1 Tax=Mycobacterium simiae TaxID=1784 RepID=UPI000416F297|nr:DUF1931 family protein [Mycobacterium simiae]PLV48946.1 hypothetical protein X011_16360 [Mycobacterium tuberculosis variant microti OV254]BBX42660.1 hypothetical protein MSIM_41110 [Mycobacterium simiae]